MPAKYHAFFCTQSRPEGHPRGCCTSKGAQPLYQHLSNKFMQNALWEKGVSVAQASCLGYCNAGPVMVVYPEGVWYQPQSTTDIDEIVESHFLGGKVVERLQIDPSK